MTAVTRAPACAFTRVAVPPTPRAAPTGAVGTSAQEAPYDCRRHRPVRCLTEKTLVGRGAGPAELPAAHALLVAVDLPGLALSAAQGQLISDGLEGFYRSGRRLLSRCHLRVAGREPVAVQGRLVSAGRDRFVGVVRTPASPGPLRDAGPHLPPSCTGVEATLAFPVVLAEARRWGLADRDLEELLPAAEGCLRWLSAAADADCSLPEQGPSRLRRSETQAHAHPAAVLGADLLAECGRPGAQGWREWAAAARRTFRDDFWVDDRAGGRPAAAATAAGRRVPHLGGAVAHLLDTGFLGAGRLAPGLLDKAQTEQVARLLGGPAMDSGWGLRSLGTKEPGHNSFGHRGGAVRVHETAVAVSGLFDAGYEREATSLLRGVLDAAQSFGYRLPEMYAGEQRTAGSAPVPHPSACRPAAVAAAAGIHLLTALAGVRPDAPAGTVALFPVRGAPLGEVQLRGLRVAGEPFAVRISRLGLGMVEEAAARLQLGG
ncbi:glycogen debranching N-terminal domain-containing protein [Streptomyces hypolithicus]